MEANGREKTIGRVLDDLRRVFQVVHGYSKRAERVGGLTGPQLWAIKAVSEGSPVRVSDLARRMYLHPSTVVGILDRLESGGIVVRTRSTLDRREVTVTLSDMGKMLVAKTPPAAQGLLLTGLNNLSEPDLQAVMKGLSLLVGILDAEDIPPRLLFSDEVNDPGRGPSRRGKTSGKPPSP